MFTILISSPARTVVPVLLAIGLAAWQLPEGSALTAVLAWSSFVDELMVKWTAATHALSGLVRPVADALPTDTAFPGLITLCLGLGLAWHNQGVLLPGLKKGPPGRALRETQRALLLATAGSALLLYLQAGPLFRLADDQPELLLLLGAAVVATSRASVVSIRRCTVLNDETALAALGVMFIVVAIGVNLADPHLVGQERVYALLLYVVSFGIGTSATLRTVRVSLMRSAASPRGSAA